MREYCAQCSIPARNAQRSVLANLATGTAGKHMPINGPHHSLCTGCSGMEQCHTVLRTV
jgi:hypothetical protein